LGVAGTAGGCGVTEFVSDARTLEELHAEFVADLLSRMQKCKRMMSADRRISPNGLERLAAKMEAVDEVAGFWENVKIGNPP
jgi:hypothetical protein